MGPLLLTNCRLVDPAQAYCGEAELLLAGGLVQEVGGSVARPPGTEERDLGGKTVIPGAVDLHVHLTGRFGHPHGYALLPPAGVTTAVDLAGPPEELLESWARTRPPVNIGGLEAALPGLNLPDPDPSQSQLEKWAEQVMERGALGVKILGGHYPLTPEATARLLEICREREIFAVFHAGTTATASDLTGFREAMELASAGPFHLAHVNSYCRGAVLPARQEAEEALETLARNPALTAESYLSPWNGTSGACRGSEPESRVTQNCLLRGGYEPTREGLREAIKQGWARVQVAQNGATALQVGPEAAQYWEDRGTQVGVSFAVNPMDVLFLLAVDRRGGRLGLPALASDGGGIPRNTILAQALLLWRFGALALEDLVRKVSLHPARILGLETKGHLQPGADADLAVLDPETARPVETIVGGVPWASAGAEHPGPARFLTTAAGEEAVGQYLGWGQDVTVVDTAGGALVSGRGASVLQ